MRWEAGDGTAIGEICRIVVIIAAIFFTIFVGKFLFERFVLWITKM